MAHATDIEIRLVSGARTRRSGVPCALAYTRHLAEHLAEETAEPPSFWYDRAKRAASATTTATFVAVDSHHLRQRDAVADTRLPSDRMDEVVTCLEMTSSTQLVPGRSPPDLLEMEEIGSAAAPVLRSTYVRIGAPLGWSGRMDWSDAQWGEELSRQGVRAWVARVDGDVAGLVELEADRNGHVGIVVFGLVPEFVGSGFGGAFLTLATEMAWQVTSPCGRPTKRVWVQTSSHDHPHALPNYESRGFRPFARSVASDSAPARPRAAG